MPETPVCPKCGTDHPGVLSGDLCPVCGAPLTGTHGNGGTEPPQRLTVLCIDDDPLVLHFYREFLDRRGYRTLLVADGLAGLACAQRERPDVILLDVMLRGLSGFDICRKLREDPALQDTPIILLTVWDDPSVAVTGRAAGATLTLRKPAEAEAISTAIAEVLGQRTDRPEGVA